MKNAKHITGSGKPYCTKPVVKSDGTIAKVNYDSKKQVASGKAKQPKGKY